MPGPLDRRPPQQRDPLAAGGDWVVAEGASGGCVQESGARGGRRVALRQLPNVSGALWERGGEGHRVFGHPNSSTFSVML